MNFLKDFIYITNGFRYADINDFKLGKIYGGNYNSIKSYYNLDEYSRRNIYLDNSNYQLYTALIAQPKINLYEQYIKET